MVDVVTSSKIQLLSTDGLHNLFPSLNIIKNGMGFLREKHGVEECEQDKIVSVRYFHSK